MNPTALHALFGMVWRSMNRNSPVSMIIWAIAAPWRSLDWQLRPP